MGNSFQWLVFWGVVAMLMWKAWECLSAPEPEKRPEEEKRHFEREIFNDKLGEEKDDDLLEKIRRVM